MRQTLRRCCLVALAGFVLALPEGALAYNRYNDGCQSCHGGFAVKPYTSPSGAKWSDSLHNIHNDARSMGAACNLCHTSSDGRNPWLGSSDGTTTAPGLGCDGCHGNRYGTAVEAAGLRAQHARKGVTSCRGCHPSDPTPAAESVKPPYYGLVDSKVAASCNNDSGTTEDWSGDNVGLDNDGDGVVDTSDPDCQANPCGNGTVDPGETCDGNCPTGCNDGQACTRDTLTGSAATCTAACTYTNITACTAGDGCCPSGCNANTDADCQPVCGNSVIERGETCDPATSCPTGCSDGQACTRDLMSGSAATCDVTCAHVAVDACLGGDGCCADGCDALRDSDCAAVCGNGVVEPGELCDGNCPTTCSDGQACTRDVLSGTGCNRACTYPAITTCAGGDGCCPSGCNANNDANCTAVCGNGVVEQGEACDLNCPTSCNDGNACTADTTSGSATSCSLTCVNTPISACVDRDGCCPAGCTSRNDNDCSSTCGNGRVDPGETCDGNCPTGCDDGLACTRDVLTGSAATCSAACTNTAITTCGAAEGCCPVGCNANTDGDCSPVCGNGVVESTETCDPSSACPSCNDGDSCTTDATLGSAAACNVTCSNALITACAGGDGCCPATCNANSDSDCSARCGNGVVEAGETCDGNCPTSCNDGQACTADVLTGSGCTASCAHAPITTCQAGDGCCPASCNANADGDCQATCGNGVVEAGETCDGNCPACDDGDACTVDAALGSANTCNLVCTYDVITACSAGDGCCPAGCTSATDADCQVACGNGIVEAGETCDPCPATCDDAEACTADTSSGSAASCTLTCSNTSITACAGGDGCCPAGCAPGNDSDCGGSLCGNGTVDPGETCDGNCPSCDDGNACTLDTTNGSASSCDVVCANDAITACAAGDGCCPSVCSAQNDADCSASCGNGQLEAGETCDPPSSCPTGCDDGQACTRDQLTGSLDNCNASCSHSPITACAAGDGCCPAACNAGSDSDCAQVCGNGVLEAGEACDPPSSCPTSCDDQDACTADELTGSAVGCDAVCRHTAIADCPAPESPSAPAEAPTGCGCGAAGGSSALPLLGLFLARWLRARRRD